VFDSWFPYVELICDGIVGQIAFSCNILAMQGANPLLVQLLCYVNVLYAFAADRILF